MESEFLRDDVMYAAVFGVFAFSWFGWAQENPPGSWRALLGVGSGLGLAAGVTGGVLASRNWDAGSALESGAGYAGFGIIVLTEVLGILIGCLVLARRGRSAYASAWTAFVVGVHFVPLAVLFQDRWLYLLAALVVAVPFAAIALARRTGVEVSALVGATAGSVLLAFAARGLVLFVA